MSRNTSPDLYKDYTVGAEMFVLYYLRHMARSSVMVDPRISGHDVHVVTIDGASEGSIRSNTRHDISIGFAKREDGLMFVFHGVFTSNRKESFWHSFETELMPLHAAREKYARVSRNATWRGTIKA